MLEIKHVYKSYGNHVIFHDLNLAFNSYGMYGIYGESGIGKSTLLNIISNYDTSYTGEVLWHHERITKENITYIFQEYHLIEAWKGKHNTHTYSYFKLYENENYQDSFIKKTVRNMSQGQKQRIALYRAMNTDAAILLCDEPTASLDSKNAELVMEKLKEYSKNHLVIVVSHKQEMLEKYCDEVYDLHHVCYKEAIESKEINIVNDEDGNIWKLLLLNLHSHMFQNLHMLPGFLISILCFLFCFSLVNDYQKYFIEEMKNILPDQQYIFMKNELSEKDIRNIDSLYTYVNIKDFEVTGIGNEDVLVFPQDLSKRSKKLYAGTKIRYEGEIIINETMAKHLLNSNHIEEAVGKTYQLVLSYKNNIKYKNVKICGIEKDTSSIDMIYIDEYANIKWCKQFTYDYEIESVFIESNDSLSLLKENYASYTIHCVNEKVSEKIDFYTSIIKNICILLAIMMMILSFLLFMITIYFNILHEEKNYMIFLCFGAQREQLYTLVILENIAVMLFVQFVSFISFLCITGYINQYLKTVLSFDNTVSLHYGFCFLLTFIVYMLFTVMISILPCYKLSKIDPVKLLNH